MRKIDTRDFHVATRGTSREINRRIALNLIREHQPIPRADLARRMGVTRGVSGVGIVPGPGRHVWGLSLREVFNATEDVRIQLKADPFNAFNRANFRNPDTNRSRLNAAGDCGPCRSQFGTISDTAPGRNIQLGMKVTF